MKKNDNKKTEVKKVMQRQFEGTVLSKSGDKTVRVLVKTIKMHAKYKKQFSVSNKFAVHDEKMEAKTGDVVSFVECRPLSKTKKWRLVKVLKSVK